MKTVLPLLCLGVALLTACTTMSNRRDLFRPTEPKGEWTAKLHGEPPPKVKAKPVPSPAVPLPR